MEAGKKMNNAEREAVEKKQAGDPNELDTSRLHFLLLAFQRKSTNADTQETTRQHLLMGGRGLAPC